jgi:hypothetical protein
VTDNFYTITKVPRDPSAVLELLGIRPPAWEYLLFAARLQQERAAIETKWRDYALGYSMSIGAAIEKEDLLTWAGNMISRMRPVAANIEKVISSQAQEAAFGKLGESGNPDLIDHMAKRLIGLYEQLIDWADDFRAARLPDGTERFQEVGVLFVSQPIATVRQFVDDFTSSIEDALEQRASGKTAAVTTNMTIRFEIDDEVAVEFKKLLAEAVS